MNYLDDVPEDKVFILGDKRIKNLYGLLFEFRELNDEAYVHYAADDHNYFADWVMHVILDQELADALRKTRSRKDAIDVLENAIDNIRKGKGSTEVLKEIEFHPEDEKTESVEEPAAKEESPPKSDEISGDSSFDGPAEVKQKESPVMDASVKDTLAANPSVKRFDNFPKEEKEAKLFLWKHFGWEMAKEFMYGLAFGILIGMILAKMFFR